MAVPGEDCRWLYLVRTAPHARHVEEVLEGVGGPEELCECCPGVPVEGIGEVGAAHVGGAAARPACQRSTFNAVRFGSTMSIHAVQ